MAESSGKDLREGSLQTHGLNGLISIAIESFIALNSSAFLISFSSLLCRAFNWLSVWLSVLIVFVIGGYMVALLYRRDRIGYLYAFCVGFGCAIALRHRV